VPFNQQHFVFADFPVFIIFCSFKTLLAKL